MTSTLLVRGGLLVPGDGHAQLRADLLIEDGRIAAIGAALPVPGGAEVLEADGRLVVPGFVDAHSHADAAVFDSGVQLALLIATTDEGLLLPWASPYGSLHHCREHTLYLVDLLGHPRIRNIPPGPRDRAHLRGRPRRARRLPGVHEQARGLGTTPGISRSPVSRWSRYRSAHGGGGR